MENFLLGVLFFFLLSFIILSFDAVLNHLTSSAGFGTEIDWLFNQIDHLTLVLS